jgi:hypothetical protein
MGLVPVLIAAGKREAAAAAGAVRHGRAGPRVQQLWMFSCWLSGAGTALAHMCCFKQCESH